MSRIGSDSQQYYQNRYIQIAGFRNGSVFITSRTEELSCVRAPARKPRWLNPAPCTAAKGMYLVGARKQKLPGATLLWNAGDVTWKRNGGEYAWSFLRTSRAFDISSTKRCCRGCIGCEQTAAKRDGRPKTASTGTWLSDVDISYDQSPRGQKFAAVPEEISGARWREKPTVCRRLVNSDQSELLPEADIGSGGGHVGFGATSGRPLNGSSSIEFLKLPLICLGQFAERPYPFS
jgi:hypothetical protein